MSELPIKKITIDDEYSEGNDLGVSMIAFTRKPAIVTKGIAFSSHEKKMIFADEPKMRICAPLMIPSEIYRNDEDGEYFVQFTEEETEKIFCKFMSTLNNQNLFNVEHTDEVVPAYVLEAWIVTDPETDKSKSFGIDVTKGTIMCTAQITDKDYYNELVDLGKVGFSIEGFFGLKFSEQEQTNTYTMKLPDGEHVIEDKIYVVKDGEVVQIKDVQEKEVEAAAEVEEPIEEEVAQEEEVVEEEPKEEEVAMAVDPKADEAAILDIVAPALEALKAELLQVIADKLAQEEVEEEVIEEMKEQKMSAHERLIKYRQTFKD